MFSTFKFVEKTVLIVLEVSRLELAEVLELD